MDKLPETTAKNLMLADEPFIDAKEVSALGQFAAKIANLIKRGGRAAIIFVASFLAVKALDKAAETHPDNKLVNGADQIANVVFGVESLAVGGAVLIGEAGYDAMTKPPVAPLPEKSVVQNEVAVPNNTKHHCTRADLNKVLAPDIANPAMLTNSRQKQPAPAIVPPVLRGQEFRP